MRHAIIILLAVLYLMDPCASIAEIGGDDALMPGINGPGDIAIAPSGEIFNIRNIDGVIELYRSTDHGLSFELWSTIGDDGNDNTSYGATAIQVVDAAVDKLMLCYHYTLRSGGTVIVNTIQLAQTDPYGPSASWSAAAVTSDVDYSFSSAHFDTDADNYGDYYVYVTWSQADADGYDIWFARSVDQGASFESPYRILSTSTSDRHFKAPQVAYGYGGIVHVVCWSDDNVGDEGSVLYRSGTSRAASSAFWGAGRYLTSNTNADNEYTPTIAASGTEGTIVVGYETYESGPSFSGGHIWLMHSTNFGSGWSLATEYPRMSGIRLDHGPSGFVGAVDDNFASYRAGLLFPSTSNLSDPWNFEAMLKKTSTGRLSLAFDPSHDDRYALVGCYDPEFSPGVEPPRPFFDAEWLTDPGYLVWSGDLPYGDSDVLIADLEGDGIQEILYTDPSGMLQCFDGLLQVKPGFPVLLGTSPGSDETTGQVAAGDIDGDGDLEIFVGAIGDVFGFDHLGQPLDGWPLGLGQGYRYYVSLGTITRLAPLDIVVAGGARTWVYRMDGAVRSGFPRDLDGVTFGWQEHPPAIGDVDHDGELELVLNFKRALIVMGPDGSVEQIPWSDPAGNKINPVSMADFDFDGDLEFAFTVDATAYLMHHDGTNFGPEWPWTEPNGMGLSPVAIANNWGTFEPELFFGTKTNQLPERLAYMLGYDASQPVGWPHTLGANYQSTTPLVDNLDNLGTVAAYITNGGDAYAYRNLFTNVVGWPRELGTLVKDACAVADIDNDGLNELVIAGSMEVYDTNSFANAAASRRWNMSYYDPQRTSCAACTFDRVTAAPGLEPRASRVSFAGGFPNPSAGSTALHYSLPARAAVRLTIYDARGRLVREVVREEQFAGEHEAVWNGRNQDGNTVARGAYFARLKVQGPGLDENITRKLIFVE